MTALPSLRETLRIDPETPADAPAIAALTRAAFLGHPHHPPGSEPVEDAIVHRLRADGDLYLSLVARLPATPTTDPAQAALVGHIAFSPVTVGREPGPWFGLGPISVDRAYRRQGIGAALVQTGLQRLQRDGARGVVLIGDPAWYGRFGFRSLPQVHYDGVPDRYVLTLAWQPVEVGGTIRYPQAFAAGH